MNVKEMFHKCSAFLSEDAIVELAKEEGVEDKRKKKLTVVPFFWLMVLSAIESAPRGCLSKRVAFFTASFSAIQPGDQVTGLSRMALSKKLSNTNWMFFRGVYNPGCSRAIAKCEIFQCVPCNHQAASHKRQKAWQQVTFLA